MWKLWRLLNCLAMMSRIMSSPLSPLCFHVPAGHSSPSVKLGRAFVVWQFLLTFGTPAPGSGARDSVASSPAHRGPAQIQKQEKIYLVHTITLQNIHIGLHLKFSTRWIDMTLKCGTNLTE